MWLLPIIAWLLLAIIHTDPRVMQHSQWWEVHVYIIWYFFLAQSLMVWLTISIVLAGYVCLWHCACNCNHANQYSSGHNGWALHMCAFNWPENCGTSWLFCCNRATKICLQSGMSSTIIKCAATYAWYQKLNFPLLTLFLFFKFLSLRFIVLLGSELTLLSSQTYSQHVSFPMDV